MTERHKFILAQEEGLFSMTELCERFGISRKTGYKWLGRYREEGVAGLRDRSRAPKHCPHQTPEPTRELVIEARETHPRWGPRKLLDYLRPRHPEVSFPAPSTVGDILKREGLVDPRRRKRRPTHPGASPIEAKVPGEVWTADFKGEFRLKSGTYCYPLTVQADSSATPIRACFWPAWAWSRRLTAGLRRSSGGCFASTGFREAFALTTAPRLLRMPCAGCPA